MTDEAYDLGEDWDIIYSAYTDTDVLYMVGKIF